MSPSGINKWLVIACQIVLWCFATSVAGAGEAGKAIFVHGTVTVERPQSVDLNKGDAVLEGDVIVTGARSRAQLMMKDGAKLALKPGTRLIIDEYFEVGDEVPAPGGAVVVADNGSSVTTLIKGGFRTITGAIAEADPDAYEARTPVATLGIRGTDFSVVYCNAVSSPCTTPSGEKGPDDGLYVGVASGTVEMNNSAGGLVLDAGEYGAVESEDSPPKKLPGPPPAIYANEAVGGEEEEESEEEEKPAEEEQAAEEEAVAADESSESSEDAAADEEAVAADGSTESSEEAAADEEAVAADGSTESSEEAAADEVAAAADGSTASSEEAAADEVAVAADGSTASSEEAAADEVAVAADGSTASSEEAAAEEEAVAADGSTASSEEAAAEEDAVAADGSTASSEEAAAEEEAVAADGSTASSEQSQEEGAVAATDSSTETGEAAGGSEPAVASEETDVTVVVAPVTAGGVPSPSPAPVTVTAVSVQTNGADVGSPDADVDVSEPPVIEVIAQDESGNPVDLDTGTPVDPVSGNPIVADFRDVTFATGPLLQDLGFTGVSSNPEGTFVLGLTGDDLTTFAGPSPADEAEALGTSYDVGTAVNFNVGFDPISGMRWGRWSEGSATVVPPGAGSSTLPLADQSMHWVLGPQYGTPPVIPQGGSATYDLIAGNTDPTDNLGNVGVLGSANLLADFTNQTVMTDVVVSISGSIWSGNGTSALNGHLFGGAFATVLIDNLPGAGGRFSGFLSGLNQAEGESPTGAGLSYEMENTDGNAVTGVVVFGPPRP